MRGNIADDVCNMQSPVPRKHQYTRMPPLRKAPVCHALHQKTRTSRVCVSKMLRTVSCLRLPSHQTFTDVTCVSLRRLVGARPARSREKQSYRSTRQPHVSISTENDAFSSSVALSAPLRRCCLDRRRMCTAPFRVVDRFNRRAAARPHHLQEEIHWIPNLEKTRQAVHHLQRLAEIFAVSRRAFDECRSGSSKFRGVRLEI